MLKYSFAFLFSLNGLACPDLSGNYDCPGTANTPQTGLQITFDQTEDNTTYSIREISLEQTDLFIIDGTWRPVASSAQDVEYSGSCTEDSLVFDLRSQSDDPDQAQLIMKKEGKDMTMTFLVGEEKVAQKCFGQ